LQSSTKQVGLKCIDCGEPAFFDYDNDGDLDIYVPNRFGANILFRNNGNKNHWLRVRTVGVRSNQNGIGAKVKVVAGELSMLRMIGVGSAGGRNSLDAHLGLGGNAKADLIEIRWPSVQVDVLENIPADQFITVKEGVGIISGRVVAVQPRGKQFVTWGKSNKIDCCKTIPILSTRRHGYPFNWLIQQK
jgi:hypothetical protein